LTHFVNGFFTPMTECVLAHRGTIDKYIGDCLMAFWNAPLLEPRHAEFAVRAALDMSRMLVSLNEKWRAEAQAAGRGFAPIGIGIGIATGPCCVGNLGSEQRFDYSVLGDDVNLASRLEGQTKVYHLPIIISEETRNQIASFALLELDLLRVKGRTRPSRIFGVLGDETMADTESFKAVAAQHQAMLDAFRARQWGRATSTAEALEAQAPAEIRDLYGIYLERIARLADEPPPIDWDGVVLAETK
jgi:adenylate cyclase